MQVGVLSDTHLTTPRACAELAETLLAGPFAEVEAIIHAGDVVSAELESLFQPLPWYGVRGNMDHNLLDVPLRRRLLLEGKQIGIMHGWGPPEGLEQRVLAAFAGQSLDVLVYGHSHFPACHTVDGILLFNPGSPTERRRAAQHTVGLLELSEQIRAEIVILD